VDPKSTEYCVDETDRAESSEAKPEVPISRKPKRLVHSTGLKRGFSPEDRRIDRDEVLDE
jgi:hypothetical protein